MLFRSSLYTSRCLKNIQTSLDKGRYKEPLDVYRDISLVFWNALFYNEPKSQISADAEALKVWNWFITANQRTDSLQSILEIEWKKRNVLPTPRTSPPPSSAQKVHGVVDTESKPPNEMQETKKERVGTPLPLPILSTSSSLPAPTPASTSAIKHTPTQQRPVRGQTPEAEVDVVAEEDGQEEEGPANRSERDPLSEEIVKQLERGLPNWPGLGPEGWMGGVSSVRYVVIWAHNF